MSQQNAATPRDFIDAVEKKFGVKFVFDLACTTEDCIIEDPVTGDLVPNSGYFFDQGVDALEQDWSKIHEHFKHLDLDKIAGWVQPPFKKINRWAQKCRQGTDRFIDTDDPDAAVVYEQGLRLFSLFPVGAGTDWFADHVLGQAAVYFIRPRITFIDPRTGQPFVSKKTGKPQTGMQDVMLVDWSPPDGPGVYTWKWKNK